jgi:hypothetical protein
MENYFLSDEELNEWSKVDPEYKKLIQDVHCYLKGW